MERAGWLQLPAKRAGRPLGARTQVPVTPAGEPGQSLLGTVGQFGSVRRLLECLLYTGGLLADWTTRELHERVLARHRLTEQDYTLGQLRYDLGKLRAHSLAQRVGTSRRYRLTADGVRLGALLVKIRTRLLGPISAEPTHAPSPRSDNPSRSYDVSARASGRRRAIAVGQGGREAVVQSNLPLGERPGDDIDMRVGVDGGLAAAAAHAVPEGPGGASGLDHAFAASHLLDVIPNPWRGSELARRVFGALLERHPRALVVSNYGFVLEELRKRLEAERDRLPRAVFSCLLEEGTMRFIVAADDLGFNRLPRQIKAAAGRQANREDGGQYLLNLFDRTSEEDLTAVENRVATFLDQQERLFFWYRNRARQDYYVQGWKRGRIYAGFIFTLKPDGPDAADPFHQVFVVETKGLHLKEAADTEYKRSVFDICSAHATRRDWAQFVPAMRGKSMRFEVVDEAEWQRRLTELLAG